MGGARRWVIGAVVVAVVGAAGVGVVVLRRRSGLAGPEVTTYLRAWQAFDPGAMAAVVDRPPPELASAVTAMKRDLQIGSARFTPGPQRRAGGGVDAAFTADLELAGLGPWHYGGTLHLVHRGEGWRVQWSPSSLHPELVAGQRFARTRTWAPRAAILGVGDAPLAATTDVVLVGLEPDRIKDEGQAVAALHGQLGVDPATVTAALHATGVRPNFFVPVATLAVDRFTQVRAALEPVPGVFFHRTTGRVSPSSGLAAHVLGQVGEATAERLSQLGAPYVTGDQVGLSGLESAYERQLAGRPSGDVHVVDATGAAGRTLFRFPGVAPQPVRTTLDATVQQAAESALAGVAQPAALVAVDAGSGELRAVVSRPLDQPFDRALDGSYPPGSTFKVVTTAALLQTGVGPDTPVACPPTATVGGQSFKNFEGEALGATTLRAAFAQSCNTAFVGLSTKLASGALEQAAATFGFGSPVDLHLAAAGGRVPAPVDSADKASEAIGQGRVVASPLQMATVAAAVASGQWRPPRLLAGDPPGPARALDAGVAGALRGLMGEVVRTGTGTAAAVPGPAVSGKTGTAEFGGPDPNATHAWFIGFRGSLAFAVLVEGGGVGGRVAAPLAARFLAAVPG
ncbi:MAG: penicillin-binding transpeptidase domain-containing protein [Acidimicrobiales bacterium]